MRSILFIFFSVFLAHLAHGQFPDAYTSYLTGDTLDADVQPDFGICMMGGGIESDAAMVWFLEKANGGDVVVIRTSGTDGYNNYMFNQLGVTLNSVETIVFHSAEAATDTNVIKSLNRAEAIWIAGGDQSDYVDYWLGTPVEDAINNLILEKGGAIGGSSAGMAILSQGYYTAHNGTIDSPIALSYPFSNRITLGWDDFLSVPFLGNTVTDTHFNERTRYGRLTTFMARLINDHGLDYVRGIGVNKHVAVVIDGEGIARAYGDYPQYSDEFVYFLQSNCEVTQIPEIIQNDQALTWNRMNRAVKVYRLPATPSAANYFDLNDWRGGEGGEWQNWYVVNGELTMVGNQLIPNCMVGLREENKADLKIYPNPTSEKLTIELNRVGTAMWQVIDVSGRMILSGQIDSNKSESIDVSSLHPGIYNLVLNSDQKTISSRFLKIR